MDKHKNFAYSTVATAPSPATSGTSLVVAAGHGTRFPAVPFYATVWAVGVVPEPTTAEIVRVTAISTDTLTIARAQESSSARSVIVGDQIAATITDQVLRDAEDMHYESRSTNTILGYADKGKTIDITATITQTFEADETLGDGWWVILRNATDEGTVVVTLNPDGSETIDGLTTVTMYSGETRRIMCNGAGGNFNSTLLSSGFARFTADGNFILPHGVTMLRVDLVAGGGGGGGGRGGSAGSIRHGGAGGGGGARHIWDLPATDAGNPGDTIAVDIATGGPNGTGGSAADGTNGTAGGNTTFGSLLTVYGGGGGAGGTANTNRHQGGTGGGVMEAGTSGTTHTTSLRGGGQMIVPADAGTPQGYGLAGGGIKATSGATSPFSGSGEYGGGAGGITSGAGAGSGAPGGASLLGGGGGACGGGLDTSNNERAGNAGGAGGAFGTAGSGGGGTVGAADGGAGGNGASGNLRYCGAGGGGGGSQASGTGGAGGTGGVPGGGGAGGGAGTTVGGAGGAGAIGECRVSYS